MRSLTVGEHLPGVVDYPADGKKIGRRSLLRIGFWSSIAAALAAAGANFVNILYPRSVEGFGGPIVVPPGVIPKPGGQPFHHVEGRFLLVNLQPGEGQSAGDGTAAPGGLVALWRKCPHLGCTVPWHEAAISPHDSERRRGWFICPCHGSTYTKAGVRIFGAAKRSMDTMRIDVASSGIVVQTGDITKGDTANPQRAVGWPPPAGGLSHDEASADTAS